ncbi:hypothetical protein OUZ56_011301 [Daphnia magna]|uniref:Uncharacterized protein n=1 Tax=Daphnia magna TaxID=35525 RepID=A0ABQ9YZX4_9CRUS|nr:hypothetical protein OUZ56_011301 [Daphnia magna]
MTFTLQRDGDCLLGPKHYLDCSNSSAADTIIDSFINSPSSQDSVQDYLNISAADTSIDSFLNSPLSHDYVQDYFNISAADKTIIALFNN